MNNILLLGAGRSATVLIDYILEHASEEKWELTIADISAELANKKGKGQAHAVEFDVNNAVQREKLIHNADIVISMLPASMHVKVAEDCIRLKKNMVTASYISNEMKALDQQAKDAGVIVMNEIGVDPGIDHLSAMKVIDEIRDQGGKMLQFESFTGGLVAPDSDNNPWNYKFTWNPRNVVLAGMGGSVKFKQENRYKFIPFHQLFRRTEFFTVQDYGRFEGYANRDSLMYREAYGLEDIPTIFRGTLRRPGFCKAWDVFVKLGLTDDSYTLENSDEMTYRDFINTFLAYNATDSVELKLMHYLKIDQDDEILEKLKWLGIFENTPIPLKNATPAQILQHILEQKWQMDPTDKDMIVMHHLFGYELNGERKTIESSMVCIGEDLERTAMAKTVGLPVGICMKMILDGKITSPGVQLPLNKEVYNPVLQELEKFGIEFTEKERAYTGY